MKKILIIVTALILTGIGITGAAGYFAAINNTGTLDITATTEGDLALEIPENFVAQELATYGTGHNQVDPYVVLDFSAMQPWSTYEYKDVLKITNNKTYGVWVSAKVFGKFCTNPNFCMAIAIAPKCAQTLTTTPGLWACPCCNSPWDDGGNRVFMCGHDYGPGCGPNCCDWGYHYGYVWLGPEQSKYVSFCLTADKGKFNNHPFWDLSGIITFTAQKPNPSP